MKATRFVPILLGVFLLIAPLAVLSHEDSAGELIGVCGCERVFGP